MRRLGEGEGEPDPLVELGRWLDDAKRAGSPWADAMVLATSTPDGRPSARAVVMRELDHRGLVFDSDYQSRKAAELRDNPVGAAVFLWPEHQRQARVEGPVETVPAGESDRRFRAAPREQRLAIVASMQSQVVAGPEELERRVGELEETYAGREVPRPDHWGGYRLRPLAVELWQARPNRLHDRLLYRRRHEGGWIVERLSP
ncbi:MAG: pyridoxamine 5'-phosphate oxidase [Actinomycetota bacterium]|nr:pyridoxamine 5'-phosphate oxidase [Actinomycetota bacterium]